MYALAIIRYLKPLDEVQKVTEAHRAWLREWHARGVVLAAGPFDPRTGGALLLRSPDDGGRALFEQLRDGDPFVQTGTAEYDLRVWAPGIGKDALDRL
jgi:uncharacterized protein YciI